MTKNSNNKKTKKKANNKKVNKIEAVKGIEETSETKSVPPIHLVNEPKFKCNLQHNRIVNRDGETLFLSIGGLILCNLNNYAVIPREDYDELIAKIVKLEQDLNELENKQ